MRLNATGFTAGNDIFIKMLGATSTLYLNDTTGLARAFIWAQAPSTIHLAFPARDSGGMVVDGVAVDPLKFVSTSGGSGLFYGAAMASRHTRGRPRIGLRHSHTRRAEHGRTDAV